MRLPRGRREIQVQVQYAAGRMLQATCRARPRTQHAAGARCGNLQSRSMGHVRRCRSCHQQRARATSNKQRATSNMQQATSNEQRATSNETATLNLNWDATSRRLYASANNAYSTSPMLWLLSRCTASTAEFTFRASVNASHRASPMLWFLSRYHCTKH
jgi:hypothetical protein